MERGLALEGFDPDSSLQQALAFRIRVAESVKEIPFHQHRKGQLIVALHGGITCEVEQAMWMVPTQYAVWIPGSMPHSNRATTNARICFLFIEPGAVAMPEQCCTLKISPLVRELILRLAEHPHDEDGTPARKRLVQVLFDELPHQPVEQLRLPMSRHPKIRLIAEQLAQDPRERRTLAQWASLLAMSERNLARLVVKETGLNFRRWRQQLQLIIALQLLIDGEAVQKVADALGYESTNAFITMFRKSLGTTPGRYLASLTP
ncbi:helix-turn-helix transcriptional regulator [Enterobacteriaceae bacterium H20N1]|uniref:Helix-turn-helix transcriptional regulator n=1 Tax=Dryocola boscaweniae TaxID=2925397 RepID=A0A9X3AEF8_9ENTR|nr:helix-turn-helix transcriptional regulator [Dryocola boscaweniae]MCT4704148.1 helix-turn-helix transcriptional regulator [Dryocola boscaweniae]MCT4721316.1 helix-turn-helix transcriptional regulator [Dryocola boscaweniae]